MKKLFLYIFVTYLLSANSVTLVDDTYKLVKNGGRIVSSSSETNFILKAGKLSKITYSTLSVSKVDNIQLMMQLAVKEKRVNYMDQFKYIRAYKKIDNGDKLLLDCFKNTSCNLERYTKSIQNTYMSDKFRTINYTIKGFLNDTKIHRFVDGNGYTFSAKISEVADLSRTIKMPYLGSIYRNTNAAGFERDAVKFWKQYKELYSEVLSKNNLARVNAKLSPMVDKQWVKYNPKHKSFMGEILEHHHLNNTDITVGVPRSLHRGQNNKELMHVD